MFEWQTKQFLAKRAQVRMSTVWNLAWNLAWNQVALTKNTIGDSVSNGAAATREKGHRRARSGFFFPHFCHCAFFSPFLSGALFYPGIPISGPTVFVPEDPLATLACDHAPPGRASVPAHKKPARAQEVDRALDLKLVLRWTRTGTKTKMGIKTRTWTWATVGARAGLRAVLGPAIFLPVVQQAWGLLSGRQYELYGSLPSPYDYFTAFTQLFFLIRF